MPNVGLELNPYFGSLLLWTEPPGTPVFAHLILTEDS